MCRILRIVFVLLVLFLLPLQLWAHKIKIFASVSNGKIEGYVYSSGGERPAGLPVDIVFAADGSKVGSAKCDSKGEFFFVPPSRADYKMTVDSGDGHNAEFLIKADSFPESIPQREGQGDRTMIPVMPEKKEQLQDSGLSRQIKALAEQLEEHDSKVRFHDILGGIGYIVGLCGVAAFFMARRENKQ
ncbi:MAG: hypothetical protein A2X49_11035 [Lentisphaerae bacterium GWF2_52_8]|nr:MAG: hypothetical protein A2X49_11035 [Lentisphaerae bacterium GWF2_52_8]